MAVLVTSDLITAACLCALGSRVVSLTWNPQTRKSDIAIDFDAQSVASSAESLGQLAARLADAGGELCRIELALRGSALHQAASWYGDLRRMVLAARGSPPA